jgi:hypothetical protein
MYRFFVLGGLLVLALMIGTRVEADDKKDDKPVSIEELMEKAHAGAGALKSVVGKALKADDFDKAAPPAKAWAALAPHLGSFPPPKGDKKSWKKLTKEYGDQVKSLAAAVQKKDKKKAEASLSKINKSCAGCHKVHKKDD